MNSDDIIWVFVGDRGLLPSGAFTSRERAEAWIKMHSLSGVLTAYPINIGVYEWAIQNRYFTPRSPQQHTPKFIATFSSAHLEHYHYEAGEIPEAGLTEEGNST